MRSYSLVPTMRRRIAALIPPAYTQEDRNIQLLYRITVTDGIWGGGTAAFLLVFLARLEASSFVIGAVTALPALISVFLSLPASAYVERQSDHVRTTVRFSMVAYIPLAALTFLAFLDPRTLPVLVVILWGLHAIPASIGSVAWLSVLGAAISSGRRPVVNGVRWAFSGIFTAIAVAIFGQVLDMPGLPFPLNYQIVFLISSFALYGGMFMAARIDMPLSEVAPAPAGRPWHRMMGDLLHPIVHNATFMKYIGATFVLRLGIALPVALYSIYWVSNLQATDSMIGLRTTAGQIALVAGYFLMGRLASRKGHRAILLISAAALGLYPVFTAMSPTPIWLVPAAVLWGFTTSGINISFFEVLFETAPAGKRPSFVAVYVIFANLANVVGPMIGALLMAQLGIKAAFVIAGALHIVGTGLCWLLGVGKNTSSTQTAQS